MTLDVPTLLILSAVVVITSASMFIAQAWARVGTAVDRLWTIAFASAITTALAYLVSALDPSLYLATGVGNAASVLTVWAMWSGIRAYSGRRSWIEISCAAALLSFLSVVLAGPDGGTWAGGEFVLGGTAAGALAGGIELLRGRLRDVRAGMALAFVLLAAGSYYLLRLVVFIVEGPFSATFQSYVGTGITTIATVVLVNGAAFAAVALRSQHARDREAEARNFDAMTGARTQLSFEPRAAQVLRAAEESGGPVALLSLAPEALESLSTAFGRVYADHALVLCGETAHMLLPPRALMGRDPTNGQAFQVLMPGWTAADATAWATEMRKELIDAPLDVPGSRVRVTVSVGIATSGHHGYDLGALCDAARDAAHEGISAGGNQVVVAG